MCKMYSDKMYFVTPVVEYWLEFKKWLILNIHISRYLTESSNVVLFLINSYIGIRKI